MSAVAAGGRGDGDATTYVEGVLTDLWDTKEELSQVKEELETVKRHSAKQQADLQRTMSMLAALEVSKSGTGRPVSPRSPRQHGGRGPRPVGMSGKALSGDSTPARAGGAGALAPSSPALSPRGGVGLVKRLKEQVMVLRSVLAQRDKEVAELKDGSKRTLVQEREQQAQVYLAEVGRLREQLKATRARMAQALSDRNGLRARLADTKKAARLAEDTARVHEQARSEAERTLELLLRPKPKVGEAVLVHLPSSNGKSYHPPQHAEVLEHVDRRDACIVRFSDGSRHEVKMFYVESQAPVSPDDLTTAKVEPLHAATLMQMRCEALNEENLQLRLQVRRVLGDFGVATPGITPTPTLDEDEVGDDAVTA